MTAVVIPSDLHTDHDIGLAVPGKISIVEATSTVKGKVALATASDYPSPGNDADAVTPAYLQAAIAALPPPPSYVDCNLNPVSSGTAIATCANLSAAIAALPPPPSYVDCNLNPVSSGTAIATCANLSAAIAALPPPPSYVDCNLNPVSSGTAIATCANLAAATSDCQIFDGPVADPRPDINPGMRIVGVDTSSPTCQNVKFEIATYNDIQGPGVGGQEPGPQKIMTVDALSVFVRSDNTNGIYGIGILAANNATGNTVSAEGLQAGQNANGSVLSLSGFQAGQNANGSLLSLSGYQAGQNVTGSEVTAVGYLTAQNNTGSEVTAFGSYAAQQNTGNEASLVGRSAGQNNTGNSVSLYGHYAGISNTGNEVSAYGFAAGSSNTADDVSYYGHRAGQLSTGFETSIYGHIAGQVNTGNLSDFFGHKAGYSNTGSNVSFHGLSAGAANTASNCSFGGWFTGYMNQSPNVSAFGHNSGNGTFTLFETPTVSALTGTTVSISPATAAPVGSTVVVFFSNASTIANTAGTVFSFTVTSPTVLTRINPNPNLSFGLTGSDTGAQLLQSITYANCSYFGNESVGTGPNQAVLGGPTQTPCGWSPFLVLSDARDKRIEDDYPVERRGLSVVMNLHPKAFRFDPKARYVDTAFDSDRGVVCVQKKECDGSRADSAIHFGFIAQDVLEATTAAGVPKNGSGVRDMKDEGGQDRLLLDNTALIADLVLAVQELKREIDELKRRA